MSFSKKKNQVEEPIYVDLIIAEERLTCKISVQDGDVYFKNIMSPYTTIVSFPIDKIQHIIHLHEKNSKGQIFFLLGKGEDEIQIYTFNKYEVFQLFKKSPIYVSLFHFLQPGSTRFPFF